MNLDEMWERLAQHQHYADERGYGPEWSRMCAERTEAAAWAAARAADAGAETAETAAWAAIAYLGDTTDAIYKCIRARGKQK